ncbi:kazal-type serine protease inhibitor domain-containing protein [Phthorimaea operculella]|nr:kazal-type serine protease inhibitor domain-containing protein [Phthorimaea operculella]
MDTTNLIQETLWKTTPTSEHENPHSNCTLELRNKIEEKRRLRRQWHTSRHPIDRSRYNKAKHMLKDYLQQLHDRTLQDKLERATTRNDEHSIWKLTKGHKRPTKYVPPLRKPDNTWARSKTEKAELYADFLEGVFKPNESTNDDSEIDDYLTSDQQMSLPLKHTMGSCEGVRCGGDKRCVLDAELGAHCVRCGACNVAGAPVCAVDGRTYAGACALRRAACERGKALPLAYRGPCIANATCALQRAACHHGRVVDPMHPGPCAGGKNVTDIRVTGGKGGRFGKSVDGARVL